MPTLIASYSETHHTGADLIYAAVPALGQTFTALGLALDSSKFPCSKAGSPTGNVVSKLYAITGTHGTNAVPSGAALATSDPVNIATMTGVVVLTTFTFSGANRYVMTNGTVYAITCEFTGGDSSNGLQLYEDDSTLTDPGNLVVNVTGTGWIGYPARTALFMFTETRHPRLLATVISWPF